MTLCWPTQLPKVPSKKMLTYLFFHKTKQHRICELRWVICHLKYLDTQIKILLRLDKNTISLCGAKNVQSLLECCIDYEFWGRRPSKRRELAPNSRLKSQHLKGLLKTFLYHFVYCRLVILLLGLDTIHRILY